MSDNTETGFGNALKKESPFRFFVMFVLCTATFAIAMIDARSGVLHNLLSSVLEELSFGQSVDDALQVYEFGDWSLDVLLHDFWNQKTNELVLADGGIHLSAPRSVHAQGAIGAYLTANSVRNPEKFSDEIDRTREAGGDALVIDVKGSYVYFDSSSALADEYGLVRPMYDLPEVVRRAHAKGTYVIARFIAIKDPVFASTVSEVRLKGAKSGREVSSVWVDPAHPLTLEYNRQVLEDVIHSGVDEVNFDYIRFPTEYAQSSIAMTGAEKADRLEAFLRMARTTIDKEGLDTKLGISTFAILGWNFALNLEPLGQDVRRLAPYVDIISPMAYPSTFAAGAYYRPGVDPVSRNYWLVYHTLEGYREILGERESVKLRPWIQGYFMTAKGMRDQIRAVYDAGSCGFTVWNARNDYEVLYDALGDVERPAHCSSTGVS